MVGSHSRRVIGLGMTPPSVGLVFQGNVTPADVWPVVKQRTDNKPGALPTAPRNGGRPFRMRAAGVRSGYDDLSEFIANIDQHRHDD